jgi:hypothetical protein
MVSVRRLWPSRISEASKVTSFSIHEPWIPSRLMVGVVRNAVGGAGVLIVHRHIDRVRGRAGDSEAQRGAAFGLLVEIRVDGPGGGAGLPSPNGVLVLGVRNLLEKPVFAVVALAHGVSHIVGEQLRIFEIPAPAVSSRRL